ncbi:hypothetical protein EST38_g1492 [Candolleomyces aberdarensis]|uniref:Uncharacterized protein n=1 Tax=Candolleomyces aberdarensis TaxID=2316362 RepID=A0A4Q2DY19_9AGAR|nr:hypothetical protein EST38_g1492 [Candolleomyces aberdarensis]
MTRALLLNPLDMEILLDMKMSSVGKFQIFVHQSPSAEMSRPALLSVDTDITDSPQEIDALRSQLQEWDLEHAKMKERPPKDARNYIRHARNILPLLENLAEIHPVAKVVVFTFRAVINFQYDRIENDLRVNNVFLTQADMMRVVLEVYLLAQRRNDPSVITSNERLLDRLDKIKEDVKECGNAIDTYHKETRLVKFVKSQEWKQRIMDFNNIFIEHRTVLLQLLSIRTARGVDDLHTKMDVLLSHAFNANQEWEKRVQKRLRQYGSLDSWISDMPKIQRLLDLTDDPLIDPDIFGRPDSQQDGDEIRKQRLNSFLAWLKDDLESTVKNHCENNLGTFTKKLDFHTQQLQESISRAATYVVDQLSGPHGRLHHDDLKKLWKEMDWIFCVDIKLFSMALHEYYLDRFSVKLPSGEDGEAQNAQKREEDQWTLEYLGIYAQDICQAVDRDLSGYIRISEVNAFTDEIPEGWTFTQWCVYQGIGWHYEQQIYQKRLQYLLDAYYEVLPHVTPWNRGNVQETGKYLGLFHNLSRGPIIRTYNFLPPRFLERIRRKVLEQSERYRVGFKRLAHHIDSDDTVRMLFEHNTVDSLCVLIMEHCVNVAHISKHHTVDLRDWHRIQDSIETVRTVVGQRISNLQVTFKDKKLNIENAMENFKDGLYRVCYYENFYGLNETPPNIKWSDAEVECRYSDFDILENVRFPPVHEGDPSEILAHQTWESFHPDADPDEVPPAAWTDDQDEAEYYASIDIEPREPSFFPRHLRRCNNCSRFPITDMACYHCIDCKGGRFISPTLSLANLFGPTLDYDLCGECFILPFDSLNVTDESVDDGKHSADHDLIKMTLSFPQPYHRWVRGLAAFEREQEVQYGFFSQPESESSNEEGNQPPEQVFCTQCKSPIVSGPFYKCLHQLCCDVYLCHECEDHHDFPGDAHTEDEYFDFADTELAGSTPLGSSFTYQDDQQDDGGENDEGGEEGGEEEDENDEGSEEAGGEEGEDEDEDQDQEHGANPQGAESEAPDQEGATTSSHRSWHTLVVFQDKIAEDESEFHSSGQGVHQQVDPKPRENLGSGPDGEDRVARLESRIDSLESHMNQLKEMLAELLAR